MRRRQKLMATAAPVSPSALSCSRSSNKGCSSSVSLLIVKFLQPSQEFTFDVGMSFISYPLVLTPLV
jgi:hypothetical protein